MIGGGPRKACSVWFVSLSCLLTCLFVGLLACLFVLLSLFVCWFVLFVCLFDLSCSVCFFALLCLFIYLSGEGPRNPFLKSLP